MTSKALKTALATAMLTGNADAFWKSATPVPTPTAMHNQKVDELDKKYKTNVIRENLKTKKDKDYRRRQKLVKDSLRHIKDQEGARTFFERTRISDTMPIPDDLQRGDVVQFVGTDTRPGPWTDDLQLLPGSTVEIIDVIPQSLGPPQYLVVNVTAPTHIEGLDAEGPGGKPILVNQNQLAPAPLGVTTEGFLEDWDKLDRAVMDPKYNPDAFKGAYFPGALTTRDYSAVVRDNPTVVGPAWEAQYSNKFDDRSKQRKRTVKANEKYKKTKKKGRKTMKEYKPSTILSSAVSKLSPYIGDTIAATTAAVPTAVALTLAPHITMSALLADTLQSENARKEFMRGEIKKIWKEDANRFLTEAEMRKLYHGLHKIERGNTNIYSLDTFEKKAKDTMQKKHIKKMLQQDEERKKEELRKLAEEMDKEDESIDEDIIDEDEIIINEDKPSEELRKKLQSVITRHNKGAGRGIQRKNKSTRKKIYTRHKKRKKTKHR